MVSPLLPVRDPERVPVWLPVSVTLPIAESVVAFMVYGLVVPERHKIGALEESRALAGELMFPLLRLSVVIDVAELSQALPLKRL
jgi:hypothetical protein